ncbi:MAG: hypothetical protein M3N00_00835 [Actinomycetota bacterium]|nr:hypothetical protein [Actinomycetota bacterium]
MAELPREYPPWQTVYCHFRRWRRDGRPRRARDRLREELGEAEGRDRDPSAAVIDRQVEKTTPVGDPERGYDGAKRIAGRKRHIRGTRTGWCWPRGCTAPTSPPGTEGGGCWARG